MRYIATNDTKETKPYRDDAGKRFIEAGDSVIVDGNQHCAGLMAQGFRVEWETDPARLDEFVPGEPVAPSDEPEEAADDKPAKRKATVTARDK